MQYIIINGPNLNLLGKREPHIYGSQTFEHYFDTLRAKYPEVALSYFQSNHEGALIDKLHEVGFTYHGIVMNAGAYTHTSLAIADAIAGITTPVIEVHISNVFAREAFRHHSYMAARCKGSVSGLGLFGYEAALRYFLQQTT